MAESKTVSSRPVALILKDIGSSIANIDRVPQQQAAAQLRALWFELHTAVGDAERIPDAVATATADIAAAFADVQRMNASLRNEIAALRARMPPEPDDFDDDGFDDEGSDDGEREFAESRDNT